MANQSITINGTEYVSDDTLTFGDYSGAGSVGLANIRVLVDQNSDSIEQVSFRFVNRFCKAIPDLNYLLESEKAALEGITKDKPALLDAYGDYGSRQVWVRKDIAENREHSIGYGSRGLGLLEALDNYCLLDEEELCQVEMEWEEEAWRVWLRDDLLQTIGDDEALGEYASLLVDSDLYKCYRRAMGDTNTYPIHECSSVYVDVDRIANAFKEAIEARLVA